MFDPERPEMEPPYRWMEPYPIDHPGEWFPNKDKAGAIRAMRREAKARGYTLGPVEDVPPETIKLRGRDWTVAYVTAEILTWPDLPAKEAP